MPIFLPNVTFVVFKHCLQMFMHIISRKYGPAVAGIIGALYTGVQTWRSLEVPVLFKVAGHYRGEAGQLYVPRRRRQVGSRFFKRDLGTES